MSHRLTVLASIGLAIPAVLGACVAASGEPTGESSSAITCSPTLPPGTPCTEGVDSGVKPLVDEITVTSTTTSATFTYLTPRAPAVTVLKVSGGGGLTQTFTDTSAASWHTFQVGQLSPGTTYQYTITVGGYLGSSGTLVTQWAPSAALATKLQILGQLPATQQKVAGFAFFKNVPSQVGANGTLAAGGPSMSVGVVLPDGLFYGQGYGTVAGAEPTPATVYNIASDTKLFTAAAMLHLLEHTNVATLDTPVSTFYGPIATVTIPPGGLPAGCSQVPCSSAITIRELLTHTSGLPNYGTAYPAGANTQHPSRQDFDTMVGATTLEFYPGMNRDYSGVGLSVAGRLIEILGNDNYAHYVQTQLLQPIGMSSSVFDPSTLPAGSIAPNFSQQPDGSFRANGPTTDPDNALWPVGHLFTSVADMAKFIRMELWETQGAPSYPLTTADLRASQYDLMPWRIPTPAASDPCKDALANPDGSNSRCGHGFFAGQECGAGWWYGGQPSEYAAQGPAYLGHFVQHSGSSNGYNSEARVAADVGVGTLVLGATDANAPNSGYTGNTADTLLQDVAQAMTSPPQWTSQPLPAALEGLIAMLDNASTGAASIDATAVGNVFSASYVQSHPTVITSMQQLEAQLGSCSSFTVSHVESSTSATVTLQCTGGSARRAITTTSTAPYRITGMQ